MIRFHYKILNNMVARNLLNIVTGLILTFNLIIRIFPRTFINLPDFDKLPRDIIIIIIPTELYRYCDVYLLMLFIILIFFFISTDFNNSMEEIALAIGGSKTNKFMLRKLGTILLMYGSLYVLTWSNMYTLYWKLIAGKPAELIPMKEIIFYSITTNIFIISLSLFILFLFKDIAVSTSIISAFYLIEEGLMRCKLTQTKGVLGHIYQYPQYHYGGLMKIKAVYIGLSVLLLLITYRISLRKRHRVFKFNVKA